MTVLTSLGAGLAVMVFLQSTPWIDPAPHRVQFVQITDGVQLEVLDFGGTGRPMVLLAGGGNTAHVFDEFAVKLTNLGHVYAITRRGYGASSRPESGYDVVRLGEDVLAVLDALRIESPVLIGHSIAGQEMSYLAGQHRQRIAALIYLDAAYRYAYDVPGEFEKDFPNLVGRRLPALVVAVHHLRQRPRRPSLASCLRCQRPSVASCEGCPRQPRRSSQGVGSSPRSEDRH